MQKIEFHLERFLTESNRRLLRLINAVDLRGQEILLWELSSSHSPLNLLYNSHKKIITQSGRTTVR